MGNTILLRFTGRLRRTGRAPRNYFGGYIVYGRGVFWKYTIFCVPLFDFFCFLTRYFLQYTDFCCCFDFFLQCENIFTRRFYMPNIFICFWIASLNGQFSFLLAVLPVFNLGTLFCLLVADILLFTRFIPQYCLFLSHLSCCNVVKGQENMKCFTSTALVAAGCRLQLHFCHF